MRLPLHDDFLSADGELSITAHDANGAVSPTNTDRHGVSTFVRMGHLARQTIAAAILGVAAVGAVQAGGPSWTDTGPSDKLVADSMVNQWTRSVVLDGLSPTVKKNLGQIQIQSPEQAQVMGEKAESANPSMLVQLQKNELICSLKLNGMNEAIANMLKADVNKLAVTEANRMRKAILDHEVSHCELNALDFAEIRRTQDMSSSLRMNVAKTFDIANEESGTPLIGTTSGFTMFGYTGDLMSERSADARAVLLKAKEHLGGITRRSSSQEVEQAKAQFDADASLYYTLRREEWSTLQERGVSRHDHDTIVVLDALTATVHKELKNPAGFEAWKEKNLSFDGMNQLAIDLSIGSVMKERKSILVSQLNSEIDRTESQMAVHHKALKKFQDAIDWNTNARDQALRKLQEIPIKGAPSGAPWTPEAIEIAAVSGQFYVMEETKKKLGENFDTDSQEYKELRPKIEQALNKRNPAGFQAMHAKTAQEDLDFFLRKRQETVDMAGPVLNKHTELLSVKKSIESGYQMHLAPHFSDKDQLKVDAAVSTFESFAANARAQAGLSLTYTQNLMNGTAAKDIPAPPNPLDRVLKNRADQPQTSAPAPAP
jgi:hypothetical protein